MITVQYHLPSLATLAHNFVLVNTTSICSMGIQT